MDGARRKSQVGWALIAVALTPISAAHAQAVSANETLAAVHAIGTPSASSAEAAAFSAVFSTDCPGADLAPDSTTRTEARLATGCLLNRVREAAGLRPLSTRRVLRRIAGEHSRDMVVRHYFSHTGPRHETLSARLASIGWQGCAGENLGYGTAYYATPRAMVWAWMRSTGHRENILDPDYQWIGIAIALGAPTETDVVAATYTTDFGGPA